MMKRFLVFALIAALGVFTFGCGMKKDTTENKTETTTTQTKDGKVVDEMKTTITDTTKTVRPATPGAAGKTTETTTETTTEKRK